MTAMPAVTATLEQLLAGKDLGEAGAHALVHADRRAAVAAATAAMR